MHARALDREAQLKAEVDRLQALLRLREQQLFGRKTETTAATAPPTPDASRADTPPPRPRGQQRGKPGPRRRDHSHLPAVPEDHVLPPDQCRCSRCGQPFADFPGTEDSEILEVEVRAHRRIIRRRRYRPTCCCGAHPGVVTAPPPPRLIPKSILGVSIWVTVLLDKYLFYRPTYRLLADWDTLGLDLSLGTLTDGLKRLVPLFEPVYEALVKRSQGQTLWHADETRWLVFASIEGKVGYRWYLWVFHSCGSGDLHPGGRAVARRARGAPGAGGGSRDHGGGPLQGVPGDRQGQERADRAGVLLGARASRLPDGWRGVGRIKRRGRWAGWNGSAGCTNSMMPA